MSRPSAFLVLASLGLLSLLAMGVDCNAGLTVISRGDGEVVITRRDGMGGVLEDTAVVCRNQTCSSVDAQTGNGWRVEPRGPLVSWPCFPEERPPGTDYCDLPPVAMGQSGLTRTLVFDFDADAGSVDGGFSDGGFSDGGPNDAGAGPSVFGPWDVEDDPAPGGGAAGSASDAGSPVISMSIPAWDLEWISEHGDGPPQSVTRLFFNDDGAPPANLGLSPGASATVSFTRVFHNTSPPEAAGSLTARLRLLVRQGGDVFYQPSLSQPFLDGQEHAMSIFVAGDQLLCLPGDTCTFDGSAGAPNATYGLELTLTTENTIGAGPFAMEATFSDVSLVVTPAP